MKYALFALSLSACAASMPGEDKPLTLNLWPDKAPGESYDVGKEVARQPKPNDKMKLIKVTNVSTPTLTVYKAHPDKHAGTAVIVCPGGGYGILAWDLEGTE